MDVSQAKKEIAEGRGELDANIAELVKAINEFDAFMTRQSCGGHPVQSNPSQLPEGEWVVDFYVMSKSRGWRALECLSRACDRFDSVTLAIYNFDGMTFSLWGYGVDANKVARAVRRAAAKANAGKTE